MQQLKPVDTNRIVVIDGLRGFALLGILLVHFNFWFVVSPLPDTILNKDYGILSKAAELVISTFVKGKFYFLFSFIFGLSFHIQSVIYAKKDGSVTLFFLRRAILLFIVGFIHNLFWGGDILSIYALMMIPALFIRNIKPEILLILGLLLVLNAPGIIWAICKLSSGNTSLGANGELNFDFLKLIQHGTFTEIFRYNIDHFAERLDYMILSGRMSITFGFFLVGIVFGKKGWIEKIHFTGSKMLWIATGNLILLLMLQFLGHKLNHITGTYVNLVLFVVTFFQNISAMTLFILFVVLLYERKYSEKLAGYFASLGQMSLTNYLTHTVVAFILFYGVGLGLYLKTTPFTNFSIALVFIALQMLFSRWWLGKHRSGLVEWVLRLGTYWSYQNNRKPDSK